MVRNGDASVPAFESLPVVATCHEPAWAMPLAPISDTTSVSEVFIGGHASKPKPPVDEAVSQGKVTTRVRAALALSALELCACSRRSALASVLAVQVIPEGVESGIEERLEFVDPIDDLAQRLRMQPIDPLAAFAALGDQLGFLE